MRKRSAEIIQKFIHNTEKVWTVKELALEYKITKKTLRNDIGEINQFLHSIPVSDIMVSEGGALIKQKDFDETLVEEHLYNMDIYLYKLSTKERQIYIMMILAVSQHHITMQHFAEELYVSRITIVKDIEHIKVKFIELGTNLVIDPGKGMCLKCDDQKRIEILISLYREIAIDIKNNGYFQRMVMKRMEIKYSLSEIFSYMQEYMQVCSLVFMEDVFYDIVLYLFVIFNFGRKEGTVIGKRAVLSGIDHLILYAGAMLQIQVTLEMLENFRCYINLHHLYSFVKTVDEIELYKVIMHFVEIIDQRLKLGLGNDTKLLDSLLMHIRNRKDWGSYEVELPKEYDSFINYELLEQAVNKNAWILERYLSYELSGNMKKSIVIHICVSIIRNRRYMPRLSVVIVCPGSMATGKYLEAQIKNYFDFKVIGVLAAEEVPEQLEAKDKKVDFIISTVPIKSKKYPVIKVHAFLKMSDMNFIQQMALQKQKVQQDFMNPKTELLKNMIEDIIDDKKLADLLCRKVSEVIQDYRKTVLLVQKNALGDLLEKPYIQMCNQEMTWEQAIYKAAEPLERAGLIELEYIRKSVEHVKEYGDYIVVSKGVALAHANKNYGVNEDCLSLLVSEKGITFTETEDKIYLLFCFASTGENEYLELLKSIVLIGKTEGKVGKICGHNTVDEIYREVVYCT